MPELRAAVERLLRGWPPTSLNPDTPLALNVLAIREALALEQEREAAVERLCELAEHFIADFEDDADLEDGDPADDFSFHLTFGHYRQMAAAVAAVRGREEREGG